jgi:hypothetical protein
MMESYLHTINLSLDSNLKMLYEQESNVPDSLNKNVGQKTVATFFQ